MMKKIGNEKSNQYYLSKNLKPDRSNIKKHIEDKYVYKKWVEKI
jgi:hypothetical protein